MSGESKGNSVSTEIGDSLGQLLGKEVSVTAIQTPREPSEIVVRYVDGASELISAWTIERSLAWALGAALTMIPAEIVEEAIKSGTPQQELDDNFREVVNVLATVPANLLHRRSVLESVSSEKPALQRTARQVSAVDSSWVVLKVAVDGYAEGLLAVALLAHQG
ncbi:MAG TPA: hypothetical protein VFQ61_36930 [Polyangiaceae bacterium]|nr:hypothetical protein [Polyangiaceae bacterium]